MAFFSEQSDRGGIATTVGKITDGFSKLVSQHIALARMELQEDARVVGGELGRVALFAPFVLVGYALVCVALSVLLGRWLTMAGGFALVGAANLVGGALGVRAAVMRLKSRNVLSGTLQEINRTTAVLSNETALSTERRHG
jgi:uncharacterized membrane protein YqjE